MVDEKFRNSNKTNNNISNDSYLLDNNSISNDTKNKYKNPFCPLNICDSIGFDFDLVNEREDNNSLYYHFNTGL